MRRKDLFILGALAALGRIGLFAQVVPPLSDYDFLPYAPLAGYLTKRSYWGAGCNEAGLFHESSERIGVCAPWNNTEGEGDQPIGSMGSQIYFYCQDDYCHDWTLFQEGCPTSAPTEYPTDLPTTRPTRRPTKLPSSPPSTRPTSTPTSPASSVTKSNTFVKTELRFPFSLNCTGEFNTTYWSAFPCDQSSIVQPGRCDPKGYFGSSSMTFTQSAQPPPLSFSGLVTTHYLDVESCQNQTGPLSQSAYRGNTCMPSALSDISVQYISIHDRITRNEFSGRSCRGKAQVSASVPFLSCHATGHVVLPGLNVTFANTFVTQAFTSPPQDAQGLFPLLPIIGAAVGGVLVLALGGYLLWRRRRAAQGKKEAEKDELASDSIPASRLTLADVEMSRTWLGEAGSGDNAKSAVNPILARNSRGDAAQLLHRPTPRLTASPSPPAVPLAGPGLSLRGSSSIRSSLIVDAWKSGGSICKQAEASSSLAAAADALLPGLLSVAREFPIIGPCAGVLLQFYRCLQQSQRNQQEFSSLKEQCDLGVGWVREIAPQLGSIDSALVEQALRRVVGAVHAATQLMEQLGARLDSENPPPRSLAAVAYRAVVSTALSTQDQDLLAAATTWLRDAIKYLLQTVPTVTGLQVNAKMDAVQTDVSAIKNILCDYSRNASLALERNKRLADLTLPIAEIKLGAVIGEGGFATVHLGMFHNKQCAIKVVRRKDGGRLNQAQKEAVENELCITRFLADPNILACYGLVHDVDRTLVVLEFAPYGSLWELLSNEAAFPTSQQSSLPFSLSLGWIKDLCSAVAHMFARGVKHGDIKAENLLVYAYPDRLIAKLCDFGFARQSSATMSMAGGGTAVFEAPEVRMTGQASFASDVFSIGMTCVQILTRRSPGRHEWHEQVRRAVGQGEEADSADASAQGGAIPPAKMRAARAALQRLLLSMTEETQPSRPSARQASVSVSAIFDQIDGDPRTDPTAPEYDLLEQIEDRVRKELTKRSRGSG